MRLIDVDKLESGEVIIPTENGEYEYVEVFYKDEVDNAPTVDAIKVVRCKDCKYGEPNGQYGCKCYHYKLYETHEMSLNDFCSRAERREDERK